MYEFFKLLEGSCFNLFMGTVAIAVHGYDCGKILHLKDRGVVAAPLVTVVRPPAQLARGDAADTDRPRMPHEVQGEVEHRRKAEVDAVRAQLVGQPLVLVEVDLP